MTPSLTRVDTAAGRIAQLLPPNTKERVINAQRYWNQTLRNQLGSETRLQFGGRDSQSRIAVEVSDGFPRPLAAIVDTIDMTLWRLALGQHYLTRLAEGAGFVSDHWGELLSWPPMPADLRESHPALQETIRLAQTLHTLVAELKLEARIAAINEDILGSYDSAGHSIELYWISIGMFSQLLGCSVEDLTGVVLTHELAHAFTHVGQDADGQVWDDRAFLAADREITEGLAQFYTALVANSRMVAQRSLGFSRAFRDLLQYHAKPYRVHTDWLDVEGVSRGERVRLVMLASRQQGLTRYRDFQRLLNQSGKVLHGHAQRRPEQPEVENLSMFASQL